MMEIVNSLYKVSEGEKEYCVSIEVSEWPRKGGMVGGSVIGFTDTSI